MNDKPSYEYYENKTINHQQWRKNGKLHRLNGLPAVIDYYPNGNIHYQSWYKNNKYHRPNGLPAIICYDKDGTIQFQKWYENGIELFPKEVLQRQYQFFNKVVNNLNNKGIRL